MIPMIDLKPQYRALAEQIERAVKEVLDSGHYVLGPHVKSFEQEVAGILGASYAVGVASGTDALHLAVVASGITCGDEVITTPFTFAATAEAISYVGAKPIFVDIDAESFNLAPERIEAAVTPRTRALLPVHLFGLAADMEPIMDVADRHGLEVIEDCAQSFGATIDGRMTGTIGTAGCFSFYPTKNLACYGDGGLVTTNSAELCEKLCMLRNHGSPKPYHHDVLGFNSRLDELQAAVLRIKLAHIDEYNRQRQRVAQRYDELLADVPVTTPVVPDGRHHVFCQYTIRCDRRDKLRAHLTAAGIGTAIYYPVPMHRQRLYVQDAPELPVCEQVAAECLSLPMFPELTDEQIESVVDEIKKVF